MSDITITSASRGWFDVPDNYDHSKIDMARFSVSASPIP
jgi:hypothetical protein